jgi:polyisoprenoid-binding protein YceI
MTHTATHATTGDYTVDPAHTRLGFVARHAMITKVRGQFRDFEGSAHIDADDPSKSWAKATIQTASIDTGNKDRDEHLRTNDFFDAPRHPEITFTSTGVRPSRDGFEVAGDLTIKGTTKPVTIDFAYTGAAKDPFGNERIGFEGTLTTNRKDWGLTWNAPLEAGGMLVSEKVTLELEISAIRQTGAE